jgi:hypothetical protein
MQINSIDAHLESAPGSIFLRLEFGLNAIVGREMQDKKALGPIHSSESGIRTDLRDEKLANALWPITHTLQFSTNVTVSNGICMIQSDGNDRNSPDSVCTRQQFELNLQMQRQMQ